MNSCVTDIRLGRTAIAGHTLGEAVQRRPFAEGQRQIQAFYIRELSNLDAALEWANKLPTYGYVEIRELLQFCSSSAPASHGRRSRGLIACAGCRPSSH